MQLDCMYFINAVAVFEIPTSENAASLAVFALFFVPGITVDLTTSC